MEDCHVLSNGNEDLRLLMRNARLQHEDCPDDDENHIIIGREPNKKLLQALLLTV